jgi:hypothetical protein
MKMIIAGSRSITDKTIVYDAINELSRTHNITEVVSGKARGVDFLGEQWALEKNIPIKLFPANWNVYGKKAGHIRNKLMADYADCAIIIWDGSSPGSYNMISNMKKIQKPFFIKDISLSCLQF